ncbi:MAG TPA: carboxymuconolactone decarboxylase family protein [Haliangiales bacterium]|nr:carboxymuconolactone decarboxylase family protein [Haliangiales bacterium]
MSTGPRIAPLAPPYPPEVAEDLRKLMPPGMEPIRLFTTLAHNPRVLGRVRRGGLLDPGAVALRDRELVILRTTALCGAEYEWGVHVAFFAGAAGLTPEQVAATVTGDAGAFAPAERALFDMCDALHRSATVDDALWARLAEGRQPAELVELIALAGQYRGIGCLVNALGVELEPNAPRFPGR